MVGEGTAVGEANTLRDAMQTGVRIADDVQRLVADIEISNWLPDQPVDESGNGGRVTGLMFGDGTQSNFVRFVVGDVYGDGTVGLEVGLEIDDVYQVLGRATDAAFTDALTDFTPEEKAAFGFKVIALQLEIADIGGGYDIIARYKVAGETAFQTVTLDAGNGTTLPAGSTLRAVLDGTHTISDTDGTPTTAASGAAIGWVAEKADGASFTAVDFNELRVEAFGNEIVATDGVGVGASGTTGTDTIVYTGTETVLAALAGDVENFDGSGSGADYAVTGNALDNTIKVGAGANTVTTGAGSDVVRGTLAQLAGDEITDFSGDDKVVIEGATLTGLNVAYGTGPVGGSAVLIVNGAEITFSGADFAEFLAADGPSTFNFTQGPDGVEITLIPDEQVIYRVNAGATVAAIDGGPDWIGDNGLGAAPVGGVTMTGNKTATFMNAITDAENEVDFDNVDGAVVPWQVFVDERGEGGTEYTFAVQAGLSYKIEYFYTENWQNIYTSAVPRVFDVQVEGVVPPAFEDIHPLREATDFVDGPGAPLPTSGTNAQAYNGVARKAEYIYTAGDDTLNITLVNNTQQAKVNAIQITQLGGTFVPPSDTTAPLIDSISLENPQALQDGTRDATIVLTDETGFEAADFVGLDGSELTVTGVTLSDIAAPSVTLSNGDKTATLTYALTADGDAWPNGSVGEISVAADTFTDAAGNGNAAASGGFVINAILGQLERGVVVRAINVGTTDQAPGTLATDPLEGGAPDNNRYGGAIEADTLITDAFGNPIAFEADNNAFYTSPKSNTQLNANVDGQSPQQGSGSNAGNVDLDGSAYHTYRDSSVAIWTGTYDGFANGTYIVELHFAELFWNAAGNRVGDFTVNGVLIDALDDLDVFAEAGNDDTPYVVRVPVTVTDGTVTVEVSSSAGQAGYSAIVVYEAVNPNSPPNLSIGDVTVAEGDLAEITILRSGNLAEATSVNVALTFDGAADATDVGALSATTVTFAAGEFSKTITLPITDDETEEGAETLSVTLSNPTGSATLADAVATVTIAASDSDLQAPVGTTIFELDFEGASREAISAEDFDGTLGNEAFTLDVATSQIIGGKLVVQTSEGDINDTTNGNNASNNDFTKSVDLSDPALTEIFLTTRFDNPFDAEFFDAQGLDGVVPNFAQQGIVLGTGTQLAGEMVKLVWGGVAGTDVLGVQMWTKGSGQPSIAVTLAQMAGAGVGSTDVASLELTLMIDKVNGQSSQYVTLFDDQGAVLGGTRPTATAGFFTVAPLPTPAAVLTNITSNAALTHVGVHSSDNSDADGTPLGVESFEASWDFLRLSSPQFVEPVDTVTAAITGATDVVEGATVLYDITLSADPAVATTVTVDVTAGSVDPASLPQDAELSSTGTQVILTFQPDGPLTQTVSVAVSDDTLPELAETFDVAISGIGITAGAAASVTTTIEASDGPVDSVNGIAVAGGDFSGDGLAPTDLGILTEGETTILANQQGDSEPGGRDRDYFTFTVAEGQELTGVILTGYDAGEIGVPQGFIAIDDGAQILTDPVTFANADTLKGGYVYNSGDVLNLATFNDGNLLVPLGDGEETNGPVTFIFGDGSGFTAPLPAGTYTLWLNQGGEQSTVTLSLVTAPVVIADVVLSIADAPTLLEKGDTGTTDLVFALTATQDFTGDMVVSFDQGGVRFPPR